MSNKKEKSYLIYYELHVDDRTFYVHVVMEGKNSEDAFNKLKSIHGKHYHLQLKGCLGIATRKNMLVWLKNSIPADAQIIDTKKKIK
jgi:hypothetical protein